MSGQSNLARQNPRSEHNGQHVAPPCGRTDASLKFEEGGEGKSIGNRILRMVVFLD
jgi:hypothetical protein